MLFLLHGECHKKNIFTIQFFGHSARKNVVKVITKLHRPQIGTNKTTLQPKKKIAATQIRR